MIFSSRQWRYLNTPRALGHSECNLHIGWKPVPVQRPEALNVCKYEYYAGWLFKYFCRIIASLVLVKYGSHERQHLYSTVVRSSWGVVFEDAACHVPKI